MNITGNYLIPDWYKLFPENFFSAYGMWNFAPNTPADKPKEDDTPPRSLNPLVGLAPSEIVKTLGDFGEHGSIKPNVLLEQSTSLTREIGAVLSGLSERRPNARDKRFKHEQWHENPLFRAQMQSYLAWSDACYGFVDKAGVDDDTRERMRFVLDLMTSALSPSNSLFTNPAALEKATHSGGMSVIAGFWNMLRDMTENKGMPSLVDKTAFEVGKNLGITPGKVVLKTPLIELIQYTPTTPQVHARPQLFVPPVVNKSYLIDMAPGRSMMEYLVNEGFTVFAISWRNPTAEHRDWGLDQYVSALLEAAEAVCSITGSQDINMHGICGGARIMSALLGYLAAIQRPLVHAASLIVVNLITDETSLGLFASPEAIETAKQKSEVNGVLDGNDIVQAFTWARSGDLVWNYWVNNYLLGNPPPAYDILYWSSDITRLPAKLHADLLDIYVDNQFTQAGRIRILGTPINLADVTCNKYVVAGISDHISPWDMSYRSAQLFGGNTEFVLNMSGHVQSIVNPPGNPKMQYLTNPERCATPEQWLENAEHVQASWWENWRLWMSAQSGEMIHAPQSLGSQKFPPGIAAPGEYVFEK